jgi:hypothetical protein
MPPWRASWVETRTRCGARRSVRSAQSVLEAESGASDTRRTRPTARRGAAPVRLLIVLVVGLCLLVAAAMVAAGTRRFEAWGIYLAGAAVIIGLAIVMAVLMLP